MERIQKILSRAGYGSRRACEELISAGRVSINNRPVSLGEQADSLVDSIEVDGKPIKSREEPVYLALYKPRGVLSSNISEQGYETIRNLVKVKEHVYPVGRLDLESEGLILLTNDGELTYKLTHPKFEHEKEYHVLIAVRPTRSKLDQWRDGVTLLDGHTTLPAKVSIIRNHGKGTWLRVVLREGRKRQIREMGRVIGFPIVKLIRTRIATLRVGNLKPGEWRNLTDKEINELKNLNP